ncbi:hypothetical protein SGRIM128S_03127 [Streptomyces griseomycini]
MVRRADEDVSEHGSCRPPGRADGYGVGAGTEARHPGAVLPAPSPTKG